MNKNTCTVARFSLFFFLLASPTSYAQPSPQNDALEFIQAGNFFEMDSAEPVARRLMKIYPWAMEADIQQLLTGTMSQEKMLQFNARYAQTFDRPPPTELIRSMARRDVVGDLYDQVDFDLDRRASFVEDVEDAISRQTIKSQRALSQGKIDKVLPRISSVNVDLALIDKYGSVVSAGELADTVEDNLGGVIARRLDIIDERPVLSAMQYKAYYDANPNGIRRVDTRIYRNADDLARILRHAPADDAVSVWARVKRLGAAFGRGLKNLIVNLFKALGLTNPVTLAFEILTIVIEYLAFDGACGGTNGEWRKILF